jgi:predicted DNA-binding transcriptional regulator AlpA
MNELLTATEVAKIAGLKPRTIREVYANRPDFPAPVFLSAGPKGRAPKRWKRKEVYEHFGLKD